MPLTLGLDLGTNSIGWGLVRQGDGEGEILDCGVRIFVPSVEDGWEHTPKNKGRRTARLARRTVQRRANRRRQLRKILVEQGLLPDLQDVRRPEKALDKIGDPYDLRRKALDERLEPHQIGRVLLHLCARRGFLSNRKTRWGNLLECDEVRDLISVIEAEEERQRKSEDGKSEAERKEDKEQGKVIRWINTLRRKMDAVERDRPDGRRARTLGEYLAGVPKDERKRMAPRLPEAETLRADRQMHLDEFEQVWAAQAKHHPSLLTSDTSDVKERIKDVIFHQRPLNLDEARIGNCSLEPQLPRVAPARLESQRFRLLQKVNDLEPTGALSGEYPITVEQRKKLADRLEAQPFMTWAKIRDTLFGEGRKRGCLLNLEEGSKEKGLIGNRTAAAIRKVVGDAEWAAYSEEKRERIVNDLITITDKCDLFKCLRRKWKFERKTALRLAVADLEDGYVSHSLKAIKTLLPSMEEGMQYANACDFAYPDRKRPESVVAEFLGAPPDDLRNPAVEKALHERRKVVNGVVRKHGKPDIIRVELARDLKRTKKAREKIEDQQQANRRRNEEAREQFKGLHPDEKPSSADQIKYRLWREQGMECAYTVGKTITMHELFSPEVEIDHIIPYSLRPDDSYMNKVVCMRGKNQKKGNRTPWQAFGSTRDWEEMTQRVARWGERADWKFPSAKGKRFIQEEIPEMDDFLNNQLPDTAYISLQAKKYLERLGCQVDTTKGGATGRLRSLWKLNSALGGPLGEKNRSDHLVDGDVAEAAGGSPGEKNRSDHRHHALDAVVIAVTTHSVYRNIAKIAEENVKAKNHSFTRGATPDAPWNSFSQDVKSKIAGVIVSHAPFRKLSGPLHKDTAYGLHSQKENGDLVLRYRKPLVKLTHAMVGKIADEELKEVVQKRVKEANLKSGQEAGDAFKDYSLMHPRHPNGQPVRRVRILENSSRSTPLLGIRPQGDPDGAPFKYHPYENNHHVEIFLDEPTGKKVEARFVNMMDAARRAHPARGHKKAPIVDCKLEGWKFLMSLAKNDMVTLDGDETKPYRVQDLDADAKRLRLRRHEAASIGKDATPEQKKADITEPIQVRMVISKLVSERKMRKVNVSPIGELRSARD